MKRIGIRGLCIQWRLSFAKTSKACALLYEGGQSASCTYASPYAILTTVQGSRHCSWPHFADQEWETVRLNALFQLNALLLKILAMVLKVTEDQNFTRD